MDVNVEIDDEEEVPGNARAGNGVPHASAEGSHAVEKNVAGEAHAVDEGQHGA